MNIHVATKSLGDAEDVWLIKRDYDSFPSSVDKDLGKAYRYCQSLLDTMLEQMENSDSAMERKCIMDPRQKRLGRKSGSVPEYRSLVNEAVKYAC